MRPFQLLTKSSAEWQCFMAAGAATAKASMKMLDLFCTSVNFVCLREV